MARLEEGTWLVFIEDPNFPFVNGGIGVGSTDTVPYVEVGAAGLFSGGWHFAIRKTNHGNIKPGDKITVGIVSFKVRNPFDVRFSTKTLIQEDWGLGSPSATLP